MASSFLRAVLLPCWAVAHGFASASGDVVLDDASLQAWQQELLRSAATYHRAAAAGFPARTCSVPAFGRRVRDWQRAMRAVLAGTAAERVTHAYVPCGGADDAIIELKCTSIGDTGKEVIGGAAPVIVTGAGGTVGAASPFYELITVAPPWLVPAVPVESFDELVQRPCALEICVDINAAMP